MLLYEHYHFNRKHLKRIIDDRDFTYSNIIYFLKKYLSSEIKILDIGCGVGTIDFYLASKRNSVAGIDISRSGILTAKKNSSILNLDKYTTFNVLNFPKETPRDKFDLIICSEVLEHLKDDKLAVIKIKKLLKRNGIVIASSPSVNAPLYRLGFLKSFDLEVGHLRRYTESDLTKLFTNAGLEVLETKKTEGMLRNFLFTNSFGGFLLKILNKWPLSRIVTFADNRMISIFGESNIYLVARRK